MTIDDRDINFPSNSRSDKKPPAVIKKEEHKVQKVIKGKVLQQKKSFWKRISETFLGSDGRSVSDYIIHDVLVPAAKDMIFEMIQGGTEMTLFGGRRGRNTTRDNGRSHVSYQAYFKSDRERDPRDRRPTREISRTSRVSHKFDDIILETRGEAEEVLSHLVDLTIDYGMASVADLYGLVGIEETFTDGKYGWTDLREANIERTRGGYLINLPRTEVLD